MSIAMLVILIYSWSWMCFLGFPFIVVVTTCPIFHPWATLTIKPFVWNLFCFTRRKPFKCRSLSIIWILVTNLMSMTRQYRGLKVRLTTDSLPVWWQQDRTNETLMLTWQLIGWRIKVLQWVSWLVTVVDWSFSTPVLTGSKCAEDL